MTKEIHQINEIYVANNTASNVSAKGEEEYHQLILV